MRSTFVCLIGSSALLLSSAARAQLPSIDARTFRPSTDPGASLSVEPVATTPAWNFSAASYLYYSYRPVTVRRDGTGDVIDRPLDHVLGGDFVFNFGLPRLSLGIDVPFVAAQTGDKGLPASVSSTDRAPLAALGDVALEAKAPFITYETAGFALGMKARATLPSGDRASYMGAGTTRVELHALAEYSLLVISLHASVGYMARFDRVTWPSGTGATIGDEIPWSAGFRVRPKLFGLDGDDRQTWEIAARGSLPAGPVGPFGSGDPGSASLSPVLVGLSDRITFGHSRDYFAIAGADIGVTSAIGVPAFRFIAGLGWTPREHDQDHDGVADDVDQCPEIPEDRDGFEDDDGCPEIDNDDDGVLDKEDRCPNVPGIEQPGPRNGCPDPAGTSSPPQPGATPHADSPGDVRGAPPSDPSTPPRDAPPKP